MRRVFILGLVVGTLLYFSGCSVQITFQKGKDNVIQERETTSQETELDSVAINLGLRNKSN